ncbi:MAG: PSD1 and planctomycete cytochrome C domain-containing protein [Pirellulaceae bacterium]
MSKHHGCGSCFPAKVVTKVFLAAWLLASASLAQADVPLPAKVEFNRDVRPILAENCFYCHGPDAGHREAELRLDIREEALESAAFVPGEPAQSALIERILSDDLEERMPPPNSHKELAERQKEILRLWIEQGAEYQRHWAYEPPVKADIAAGQNGIDVLVRRRLDELGLKPSPEANRRTLIRRLYWDLIGLPPTPAEVAAFEVDASPTAYENLVDRLLQNPHYGERLAIAWLDVVRFADTIGYHSDNPRNIWPYRDWVIQSFNENKPFDRFTIEQIAGDLLPDASQQTRVGSAFNRLLLTTEEGGAQAKDYEARMVADRVRVIGTAWLGQTTGCAQCHDHKFDPFTQRDFYSLGAFFADIEEPILGRREDGLTVVTPEQEQQLAKCLVSVSTPNKRIVRILPRGNWMDESGEVVKPALPHYLPQPAIEGRELTRLDLAQWLVSRDNPLTARTAMNRLWKQFFGAGLSKALNDLGTQGESPANPALLDWLVCEFMDSGWDIKHMVRTIVTSTTYRQVSTATPELIAADPFNREYARQSAFRLDAELVRDTALAVSGLLVPSIGGPSVKPYQPDRYWENLNFPPRDYVADTGESQYRRGLYVWWQRSFLHPSLLAFDAPSREECTAERVRSNIPQQALVLLNDPSYVEAARSLAARVLQECHGTPEERLVQVWQLALQRNPREEEVKTMLELLNLHRNVYRGDPQAVDELLKIGFAPVPADMDKVELAAWTHVARVVLNLHETITRL